VKNYLCVRNVMQSAEGFLTQYQYFFGAAIRANVGCFAVSGIGSFIADRTYILFHDIPSFLGNTVLLKIIC
ncbi:MAG: hypothetical protein OEW04_07195, partial [Nitrospirota bacterium]|nr:hypothetical protein [Nitrospirota bacterium]